MNYFDFYKKFEDNIIIKSSEIRNAFPDFDIRNLSLWQKKGLISKLRKGIYIFSDIKLNEKKLFYIANNLNFPSYISLYSALSFYGVIPEGVFIVTSISTKRINYLNTPIGKFVYNTIKKDLFWGYEVVEIGDISFYISDLEKTILDYLYFYPSIKDFDDFQGLRLNKEILKKNMDIQKIYRYLNIFNNKRLEKRFYKLNDYINA